MARVGCGMVGFAQHGAPPVIMAPLYDAGPRQGGTLMLALAGTGPRHSHASSSRFKTYQLAESLAISCVLGIFSD